jgi:anaerobic selenocysteine-containing dehydrogenase
VPPGRLVLQTVRSHDQYNTTVYGLDDRYRGVKGGRRVVFINPTDIESLGLTAGQRVDLVSEWTDADQRLQERRAKDFLVVAYSTPVGNAAAYYPEANALVPLDHTAAKSNTPVSKAITIRVEPAAVAAGPDNGEMTSWGT